MTTANPSAFDIVIPARFASERLPGKVLLDLAGKPILQYVWQQANKSAIWVSLPDRAKLYPEDAPTQSVQE